MPSPPFSENLPGEGEPAPWFSAPCGENPRFAFDTAAGRWVMLMFFGALRRPETREALERVLGARSIFDDQQAAFFGVSVDPQDATSALRGADIGLRYFIDKDRRVSRLYGVASDGAAYRPVAFLLDPLLRVVGYRPLEQISSLLDELSDRLAKSYAEDKLSVPVLTVPRVFEPGFCRALIDHFEANGGQPSGVMRQVEGKTVLVHDRAFKRRSDVELKDAGHIEAIRVRIAGRVLPMVERAYGWRPSWIERYVVARYDAEGGGFFRPHRDNTTAGTAHRRLAVTINLNTEEYEGGALSFPEFGPSQFRPATGSALVFGCGMLHEVLPVTRGRRYAFLPFLYDDAAARLRDRNRVALG